jgi:glutamyl-tRNA synthetase
MALQLVHEKKAFSCFCSDEWLDKKKAQAKEANQPYKYDDACRNLPPELVIDNTNPFSIRINRPTVSLKADALDSFTIMNQDKTPTYNFACAIDDMLSDISFVVRDEFYINDTPKQEYIRSCLGYEKKIKYVHIPNTLDCEKVSIKWLLEEGYLPEAISNYLILIGNQTPCKIFDTKDAIKWFALDNLSNSPIHFNLETLKDINQEHLKNLDAVELSRYVGFADAEIGKLAKVYLEEAKTTKELKSKIKPIFTSKTIPQEFEDLAKIMIDIIKEAPYFEDYDEFKSYIIKKSNFDGKDFLKVFRYLLTGTDNGPDIKEIYKYLKNYIGEIIK